MVALGSGTINNVRVVDNMGTLAGVGTHGTWPLNAEATPRGLARSPAIMPLDSWVWA